jgi:hypothetical protein
MSQHEDGGAYVSSATVWLRGNTAFGERARARIAFPGKALPDALLEDPTRVVDVLKSALVEAIMTDAPVGVAEDLLMSLRLHSTAAERFDRNSPSARALSSLQGLRDRDEISAALDRSAASASDELGSAIERLRRFVDATPAADELMTLAPDESSPDSTGVPIDTGPPLPDSPTPDRGPDPGTDTGTETGTGTRTGTGTEGTVRPDTIRDLDPGAALGALIGAYLGDADLAEQGAAIGSQLTGGAATFDSTSIGQQIGQQLAGSTGATIGAQIGSKFLGLVVDHLVDVAAAAACAVCGPLCIICTLAAEVVGDVVHDLIEDAIH